MTASIEDNFKIPPGFSVEEIDGQLYHEDLDEDDELWLIRMPCDIELSALDKKKIFLSNNLGETSIKNFETTNSRLLECCAETCEIPNPCVVLPKRNDRQLHAVRKVFKGAILISEGLSLNDEVEIKFENVYKDKNCRSFVESNEEKREKKKKKSQSNTTDADIKYEDEQFIIANNSICGSNRNKKKKKQSQINLSSSDSTYEIEAAKNIFLDSEEDKESEELGNIINSICESNQKKSKKKKRQSQSNIEFNDSGHKTRITKSFISPSSTELSSKDEHLKSAKIIDSESNEKTFKKKKKQSLSNFEFSDLDYETEAAESCISHDSLKKHTKKHSRIHKMSASNRVKVKDEPMSMNWDGFPSCSSQK